jgi:hypothetical protein
LLHSYYLYLTTISDLLLINSASKIVFIMSLNLSETFSVEKIDPYQQYDVIFHDDSDDSQSNDSKYLGNKKNNEVEEVITPSFREIINTNTGSSSISSNTNVERLRKSERLSEKKEDDEVPYKRIKCLDNKKINAVAAEEFITPPSLLCEIIDTNTRSSSSSSNTVEEPFININNVLKEEIKIKWQKLLGSEETLWNTILNDSFFDLFLKQHQKSNTLHLNYIYMDFFSNLEKSLVQSNGKSITKEIKRNFCRKLVKLLHKAIEWVCIKHYEVHGLNSVLMIFFRVIKETKYSISLACRRLHISKHISKQDEYYADMRKDYRQFLLSNVQYVTINDCCVVFSDRSGLKNFCQKKNENHRQDADFKFRYKHFNSPRVKLLYNDIFSIKLQQLFDIEYILCKDCPNYFSKHLTEDGISEWRIKEQLMKNFNKNEEEVINLEEDKQFKIDWTKCSNVYA